ncbi:MAG: sigma-54-dependent Fis family transcriptional regulator [Phycisphaerae bacterium]
MPAAADAEAGKWKDHWMADILIVDDEENLGYSLQLTLRRAGHNCRLVDSCEGALAACSQRAPDVAVVDIQLPDGSGIDLIARMRSQGMDFPAVAITAFGSVDTAVAAMKQGAADFLQKPVSMEEVRLVIERVLEERRIRDRLSAYEEAQRREAGTLHIIADCPNMRAVLALAERIAAVPEETSSGPVVTLVLGETGTGKEVIARYIHRRSSRADRPFVQVNCTAIPESLFEAELFGYERGTFTDARQAKAGLLETAHEGTLFLDEIGDMPLATQSKLLNALESGRFRRLGGTAERVSDVRIIAATNSDLARKVRDGEFREDLYYRLKVFCIELPTLRERADLLKLAEHFLSVFSRKFHKRTAVLTAAAREAICSYAWPGNVRELANVLQRAVLLNESRVLDAPALGLERSVVRLESGEGGTSVFDFERGDCTLAAIEKRLLEAALQYTKGNISEAARLLGLTRGGLRHRLEKAGISTQHLPAEPPLRSG